MNRAAIPAVSTVITPRVFLSARRYLHDLEERTDM